MRHIQGFNEGDGRSLMMGILSGLLVAGFWEGAIAPVLDILMFMEVAETRN